MVRLHLTISGEQNYNVCCHLLSNSFTHRTNMMNLKEKLGFKKEKKIASIHGRGKTQTLAGVFLEEYFELAGKALKAQETVYFSAELVDFKNVQDSIKRYARKVSQNYTWRISAKYIPDENLVKLTKLPSVQDFNERFDFEIEENIPELPEMKNKQLYKMIREEVEKHGIISIDMEEIVKEFNFVDEASLQSSIRSIKLLSDCKVSVRRGRLYVALE